MTNKQIIEKLNACATKIESLKAENIELHDIIDNTKDFSADVQLLRDDKAKLISENEELKKTYDTLYEDNANLQKEYNDLLASSTKAQEDLNLKLQNFEKTNGSYAASLLKDNEQMKANHEKSKSEYENRIAALKVECQEKYEDLRVKAGKSVKRVAEYAEKLEKENAELQEKYNKLLENVTNRGHKLDIGQKTDIGTRQDIGNRTEVSILDDDSVSEDSQLKFGFGTVTKSTALGVKKFLASILPENPGEINDDLLSQNDSSVSLKTKKFFLNYLYGFSELVETNGDKHYTLKSRDYIIKAIFSDGRKVNG